MTMSLMNALKSAREAAAEKHGEDSDQADALVAVITLIPNNPTFRGALENAYGLIVGHREIATDYDEDLLA